MRHRIDYHEGSKQLNEYANAVREFSRKQLANALKRCGLPYSGLYIQNLEIEQVIVKSPTQFRYNWRKVPIHFMELERVQRKVREHKRLALKGESKPVQSDAVSEAIALLKSQGYIILKQF